MKLQRLRSGTMAAPSSQKEYVLSRNRVSKSPAVSRLVSSSRCRMEIVGAVADVVGPVRSARGFAERVAPRSPVTGRRSRKLATRHAPNAVPTDSGWNCTPYRGSERWASAMITPSSLWAVGDRHAGNRASTASEW